MILLQIVPSSPTVPSKISHGKLDAAIPRFHDSYRKSVRHQFKLHCTELLLSVLSYKQLLFWGADTGFGRYRHAAISLDLVPKLPDRGTRVRSLYIT